MVSLSAASARAMSVSELNCWMFQPRIVEYQEPELIESGRASRRRPSQLGPSQLAARLEAGDLALGRGIHRGGVDQPRGADLRRRQARRAICALALHDSRDRTGSSSDPRSGRPSRRRRASQAFSTARCRIWRLSLDDSAAGFVRLEHPGDLHGPRRAAGPVEARRAGDDAVEVLGEALRRLHRLPPAGGAAVPVRELRARRRNRPAMIFLAFDGHLVHRAPAEVDHLLRMPEREAARRRRCARCRWSVVGVAARQRPSSSPGS